MTTCEKCQTLRWCADHGSDGVVDYLFSEIGRLRTALFDALEGLEDMIVYVPALSREKFKYDDHIDRARKAVEARL